MLNTDSLRQEVVVSRFGFQPTFVHYPCWTHTWKYNYSEAKFEPTSPGNEPQSWTPGRPFAARGPKGAMPSYTRGVAKKYGTLPGQWIYVFALAPGKTDAHYFAEIFSDSDSKQRVNPAATKSFRLDWDPDMGVTHSFPELPEESNGLGWFYTAVGVPYRLSDACIDDLEKEVLYLLDWVDSSSAAPETTTDAEGGTYPLDAPLRCELPVLYPLQVLEKSAKSLLRARSLHAISMGSQMKVAHGARAGGDYKAANRARNNLPKQAFAHGILQFIEHPKLGTDLEDRLLSGKDAIKDDLADIAFDQDRHHIVAETYARDIAGWMLRKIFRILLDGYHVPNGDLSKVAPKPIIEPIELAAKALSTCAFGIGFLSSLRGPVWKDSILGVIASPPDPSKKDEFDMAAKYGKGTLAVFTAVLFARTFKFNSKSVEVLDSLEGHLKAQIPSWKHDIKLRNELIKSHVPRSKGGRFASVEVEVRTLRIKKVHLDELAKRIGHAEAVLEALDVIGLALTVAEYQEKAGAGGAAELKASFDVAFAAGDVLAAALTRVVSDGAKRGLAVFGIVSALYTSKGDVDDMFERWASGDTDAAAAKAAMVIGSAGSIITAAGAISGVAVLGPIGAVAVAIGAIGAAIYQFVKDTKLELLVDFCGYGGLAGTEYNDAMPGWTATPLGVLGNSWDRQLEALTAIQGYFEVAIETDKKHKLKDGRIVDVHHARLRPTSLDSWTEFVVQWKVGAETAEETLTGPEIRKRLLTGASGEDPVDPFFPLVVPDRLVSGTIGSVELRVARLAKAHGSRSTVFGKARDGLPLCQGSCRMNRATA